MSGRSHVNWRARATMGLLLALVCSLSSVMFASASGSLGGRLQISSDPYTNKTSQHKTEVEPHTFSWGCKIVSAFQAGRFYDGGASNIGWATSTDCGKTWAHGFLPGTTVYATPAGSYARDTDPAVVYDAYPRFKTWMIVQLVLDSSGTGVGILVSRSTDGLTWTNPVTVPTTGLSNLDKPWIACDNTASSPYYGHCYIEFDDNSQGNLIYMTTDNCGGLCWGTPQNTQCSDHGVGGNPVVLPYGVNKIGTVVVPIDNADLSGAIAFTSPNGGTTWNCAVPIANFNKSTPAGGLRATDLISAGVDATSKVYVVWYDCSFEKNCSANDIVMTTSPDGSTWSKIQRIPIDPVSSGADHFLAGIAVDKQTSGHLGLIFYFYSQANCTQATCQLDVGYVCSNGGSTWSAKKVLAGPMRLMWLANTNQGYMVGDYFSASYVSTGKAYPVFMLAKAPSGNVFNEAAYTWSGGLC